MTKLVWIDDQIGYRCPECKLFVCIPHREDAHCPHCPHCPASDEPARCPHGQTEAHWYPTERYGGWCPGWPEATT